MLFQQSRDGAGAFHRLAPQPMIHSGLGDAVFEQLAHVAAEALGTTDGSGAAPTKAMWRWPSFSRCSVASWQPRKLSVPTKSIATSGTGRTIRMVGMRRRCRLSKKLGGGLGGADHHAGGVVALQRVGELLLPGGRLAVGQKQHEIVVLHLPAQARSHLRIEGVGDVVQQQTDLVAALVAQVGGGLVVDIAEFVDGPGVPAGGCARRCAPCCAGSWRRWQSTPQMAGDVGNGHIAHGMDPVRE